MAVHASHAALPYPIKGARYSMLIPYLDADGDPTLPTTPDTEISEDNGAATDAAEEATATSGMDGMALITFSGAETDCSCLAINFKVASGPKATLGTLYPRVLATVGTGTLSAGSAGGGTLGTLLAYDVTGCFIKTTGGTGGGGTGGANNQARKIITYNTGTGAFTVEPNWETTPSTDTTYAVLLPEGVTLGMLRALNPATAGRTLVVESDGMAYADAREWLGGTIATPTTTGVPHVVLNDNYYHADIHFTRDQSNTQDEYTVTWFKNGVRLTSGVTSPTIQVVKRADGTDLIASTSMTEVGTTETFKYDATGASRQTAGEAVIVIVGGTIDSASRSFSRLISRDST